MGWIDFRSPALSSQKRPETQQPRSYRKAKWGEQEAREGGCPGPQITRGLGDTILAPRPSLPPNPQHSTASGGGREASDSFLKNRILKVSSLQRFRGGG